MCLAQALELTHKHIRLHKQTYMLTLTHRPGECNISSHTCTHSAKWMYATMCEVCHIHQRCYTELPTILASGIRNDEYKQKQTKKKKKTEYKTSICTPHKFASMLPIQFSLAWSYIWNTAHQPSFPSSLVCTTLDMGQWCTVYSRVCLPRFCNLIQHTALLHSHPVAPNRFYYFPAIFFSFLVRYRCCCSLLIATDSMPAVLCLCVCMCARAFATLQADLGWMNLLQRPVACVRIIHLIGADIATHALLHMHCE